MGSKVTVMGNKRQKPTKPRPQAIYILTHSNEYCGHALIGSGTSEIISTGSGVFFASPFGSLTVDEGLSTRHMHCEPKSAQVGRNTHLLLSPLGHAYLRRRQRLHRRGLFPPPFHTQPTAP